MDTISFREEILQLIAFRREGEYWGFKKEWYKNKPDLLHDIICMANNLSNRYFSRIGETRLKKYFSTLNRLFSKNVDIRQSEEQLDVYKQKDEARELLTEKLNRTPGLFAEELSRVKAEKEENQKGGMPYGYKFECCYSTKGFNISGKDKFRNKESC